MSLASQDASLVGRWEFKVEGTNGQQTTIFALELFNGKRGLEGRFVGPVLPFGSAPLGGPQTSAQTSF
jgi:hypothetical protein